MKTLEERKINGLVEAQIGFEKRDREQALKGLDEFIQCSITEMELDRIADEAESYDHLYPQYDEKP